MSLKYAAAHQNSKGPGDSRPTALQIIQDEDRIDQLKGKVILITGCSSGIGIETARALKATGATLFLTARNLDKARAALGDILDNNSSSSQTHLLRLDLESLDSVRSCAAELLAQTGSRLNILIANAGVRYVPEGKTKEGFETHFGVNHLAHFLLFRLLAQAMLDASTPTFHSRVVVVSSTAHREYPLSLAELEQIKTNYYSTRYTPSHKYDPKKAYGHSKLSNVYMASEIERQYGARGLHAWSVHPGGIRTGLQRPNLNDALVFVRSGIMKTLRYMQNAEQGASTSVWAAISRELEGTGGKYLERCQISEPAADGFQAVDSGHAPWAYDGDAARKLWEVSTLLTGSTGE